VLPHKIRLKIDDKGLLCLLLCCFWFALPAYSADGDAAKTDPKADAKTDATKKPDAREPAAFDFEHEDTFMDIPDALRSRQFVHRAILSTIIRDSAKVQLGSFYLNQLLGFNAIYQPSGRGGKSFAKYASGVLGVSLGYSTQGGHSVEGGIDLSGVSNLVFGYRYFFQSEHSSFWPFLGAGLAMEMAALRLSDIPVEAKVYQGSSTAEFFTLGALIPLVDLAIRAEAKFVFYGLDRLMLTTGVGVVFFL
jgi:hypothetical protein